MSHTVTATPKPGLFPPPDSLEFCPEPAWTVESDLPPPEPALERAVWLLYDTQESPRRGETVCRRLLQLPDREPGKKARTLVVDWNPWRHTLCIHSVRLLRAGDEITVMSAETSPDDAALDVKRLPDGRARLTVPLPVQAGDLMETRWTLRARTVAEAPVEALFHAGASLPVIDWRHSLRLPPGVPLPRSESHRMPIPAEEGAQGGEMEISWTARRIERADTTPALPPWIPPLPWVEVSGWKSWAEAAAAFHTRWQAALGDAPAKLPSLKGSPKSPPDILQAALRHVQDSLALIPGSAAMPLRTAQEVLASGCATSAEKALLFTLLARKSKAVVTPLLASISLRHGVVDLLPCLDAFDRVLLRVELDGGEFLLDPAAECQGGKPGQQALPACGFALPVNNLPAMPATPAEYFIRVPAAKKGRDRMVLREIWTPDAATGAITLDWTLILHGRCADDYRRRLQSNADAAVAALLPLLQLDFPDIKPENLAEPEDDREENVLTFRGSASSPRWGRAEAGGGRQFQRNMHTLAEAVRVDADSIRRLPLAVNLDGALHLEHSVELRASSFPSLRSGQKAASGKWLRAQREDRFDGQTLLARCEMDVASAVLEPGEIRAWKQDAERAAGLLGLTVVLPGHAGKSGVFIRPQPQQEELTLDEEDMPRPAPRQPVSLTATVEAIRPAPRPRGDSGKAAPATASHKFVAAAVIEGDAEEAAVRSGASRGSGGERRYRLHSGPKQRVRAVPLLAGLSAVALVALLAVVVMNQKKKKPEGVTPEFIAAASKVSTAWDESEKALTDGDAQRAEALLKQAELQPHDPAALLARRGRVALLRGQTEQAEELTVAALRTDADCAEAHAVAGEIHFARGRFREAAASLEQGIPDGGGTVRQWQILAQSQLHLNRRDAAETAFRTAWRLAGEKPQPALARLLATLLHRRGAGQEAASMLAAAVAASPENSALQLEYAALLADLGDLRKAAEVLSAAEKAAPGDAAVQIHHAGILARQQQFSDALKRIQDVKPPPDPVLHGMLADVYAQCGEEARALGAAEQHCRLDPFDAQGRFRLGRLLEKSGKSREALAQLMRSVELDPSSAEALEALAGVAEKAGELSIAGQARARLSAQRSGESRP